MRVASMALTNAGNREAFENDIGIIEVGAFNNLTSLLEL